uniref:STT3/PglB/AglB core domain-containing protein n=1 Tax=Lactuca sativa TaxID=4236 RepID=A0A9R1V8E8_LACSA|nr:hypothetical protein LSAT_V11C600326810 [Lactuca sativa]
MSYVTPVMALLTALLSLILNPWDEFRNIPSKMSRDYPAASQKYGQKGENMLIFESMQLAVGNVLGAVFDGQNDENGSASNAQITQITKMPLVLPVEASIFALFLIVLLGAFYVVHSVWDAAEAYSAPSIVLTSHSHDGLHVFDDFREAYAWLSHNTEVDDKVASWWDYGYQTTAMANRTVIVDNNTWNNTHITTVGTAMSSPEKDAWQIFNSLDVKYVLVVFGGIQDDDLSTCLNMIFPLW